MIINLDEHLANDAVLTLAKRGTIDEKDPRHGLLLVRENIVLDL